MSSILFSELADLQTSKFVNVGAFALLIFDFCITFQDETWFRPWDITHVIFVISRYLPLIGAGLTVYGESFIILIFWVSLTAVIDALSVSVPPARGKVENSIIAAEGLLVIRTWAFWQRSKRMLIGLVTYGALTVIAITFVNVRIGDVQLTAVPDDVLVYILLALFECVILALTVYKKFSDYWKSESSIVTALYGGSMFYMLCIIAITITNVLNDAVFPVGYKGMFITLQVVIHSILASRIMFHIRNSDDQLREMHTLSTISAAMQFGQPLQMQMTSNDLERRNNASSEV
ncbi:hypothetical protein BDR04DRAFT_1158453 [Suillus decipiens]|nr:hypothetical protein BDR04DRAFT_1158453 [Suillus decipiens]